MKSMTGYGRAETVSPNLGIHLCAEISGINRKQLDLRVNLVKELQGFEPLIRELISARISRGCISFRLTHDLDTPIIGSRSQLNEATAQSLIQQINQFKEKNQIQGDLDLQTLLLLPGVVTPVIPDFNSEEIKKNIQEVTLQALDQFDKMRCTEGIHLQKDFEQRLCSLQDILQKLEYHTESFSRNLKNKLLQQLQNIDLQLDTSDERLHKEILFYCQRADVTEEITRLKSHFNQMKNAFKEELVGRKIDFIVQEISREITTLGNKAAGTETSPLIVEFKTELERIREQIQNIE